MQLSEAYTDKTLITTLRALYVLQIHACTQISPIRENQDHFKVLFGYFCYVEKKQVNLFSMCNVPCKTLEKGPYGSGKGSFKETHAHITARGV